MGWRQGFLRSVQSSFPSLWEDRSLVKLHWLMSEVERRRTGVCPGLLESSVLMSLVTPVPYTLFPTLPGVRGEQPAGYNQPPPKTHPPHRSPLKLSSQNHCSFRCSADDSCKPFLSDTLSNTKPETYQIFYFFRVIQLCKKIPNMPVKLFRMTVREISDPLIYKHTLKYSFIAKQIWFESTKTCIN